MSYINRLSRLLLSVPIYANEITLGLFWLFVRLACCTTGLMNMLSLHQKSVFKQTHLFKRPLLISFKIPVCMYHGTPAERAELRRTVMLSPDSKPKTTVSPKAGKKTTKIRKTAEAPTKRSQKPRSKGKRGSKPTAEAPEITTGDTSLRRSRRIRKSTIVIESDDDAEEEAYQPEEDDDELQVMDVDSPPPAEDDTESASFPIVLTTYEMIIKDRVHLARYNWGYIVVDEGHRLKNLDCKLMKEIKKYSSAGRMILTGTPLHVSFFFSIDFLKLIPNYF